MNFDLRRKIFKRFYRGGSELERTTSGTGLGLYLVKSLIGKMKGQIHTHGRGPLGGATFEVELPGRAIQPPVDESPPEIPPHNAVQGLSAAQEPVVRTV